MESKMEAMISAVQEEGLCLHSTASHRWCLRHFLPRQPWMYEEKRHSAIVVSHCGKIHVSLLKKKCHFRQKKPVIGLFFQLGLSVSMEIL